MIKDFKLHRIEALCWKALLVIEADGKEYTWTVKGGRRGVVKSVRRLCEINGVRSPV